MNTKLMVIIAIVAILAAVMVMGCIDKDVQLQINNTEFRHIAADALHDLAQQLEAIETAQDNGDFVTAKNNLATFDTTMKGYINEFEEMKVAANTLPCKKALITAFKESRIFENCAEVYLEEPTVDNYVRYGLQMTNLTNQVEIAAMLGETL